MEKLTLGFFTCSLWLVGRGLLVSRARANVASRSHATLWTFSSHGNRLCLQLGRSSRDTAVWRCISTAIAEEGALATYQITPTQVLYTQKKTIRTLDLYISPQICHLSSPKPLGDIPLSMVPSGILEPWGAEAGAPKLRSSGFDGSAGTSLRCLKSGAMIGVRGKGTTPTPKP